MSIRLEIGSGVNTTLKRIFTHTKNEDSMGWFEEIKYDIGRSCNVIDIYEQDACKSRAAATFGYFFGVRDEYYYTLADPYFYPSIINFGEQSGQRNMVVRFNWKNNPIST